MSERDSAVQSGPELAHSTSTRIRRAQYLSNGFGAVVVFVFLLFFLPIAGDPEDFEPLLTRNGLVLVAYLVVAMSLGTLWGRRRFAQVAVWLDSERPATDADREVVLRLPLQGVTIAAVCWGSAALLFIVLNLSASATGALTVGATILLGGATTSAFSYLAIERIMQPVTALALATGPPRRPIAPGVAVRLAMAWLLGTGVPVLGVAAVTSAELAGAELDDRLVLTAALFLAALVLVLGLAAILVAARSVAEPVAGMRLALGRVEGGDFGARVAVNDGSEVGLLQAGFNRMTEGLAERERIREAFGIYVDREVAEHILREGTSLAGEEVDVTMMFTDIRNFTSFAERSAAREVVATINRLFERAVPIIHAHGGHVDKFVGDGLLAVFGAPRRQQDHADQALAAALEIERAVADEFNGELLIGVGLNSGTVLAGNVGGAGRFEFSVIGDAVNVAARVEAATRRTGDTVLLSEHTKHLLSGNATVSLEERPTVPLKGKTRTVALYAPATDRSQIR